MRCTKEMTFLNNWWNLKKSIICLMIFPLTINMSMCMCVHSLRVSGMCAHVCAGVSTYAHMQKERNKSILCGPYTHWDMVNFLVASPAREDESFSICICAGSHQLRRVLWQTEKNRGTWARGTECRLSLYWNN